MNRQTKILIIGGVILILQLIYFRDYISPFHWGHLKVSGLVCTCPDETVIGGRIYLRHITPDSIKKYDIDYSEIYVTERPFTNTDPMGVDTYIIEGKVIGKDRVSENDPWNPKFRVEKWKKVDILKDWGVKGLFWGQFIVWLILFRKSKNKNGA